MFGAFLRTLRVVMKREVKKNLPFKFGAIISFQLQEHDCAGLAQLVEHRFCKPTVVGSNPMVSSIFLLKQ
jgi:hypothetical protein